MPPGLGKVTVRGQLSNAFLSQKGNPSPELHAVYTQLFADVMSVHVIHCHHRSLMPDVFYSKG